MDLCFSDKIPDSADKMIILLNDCQFFGESKMKPNSNRYFANAKEDVAVICSLKNSSDQISLYDGLTRDDYEIMLYNFLKSNLNHSSTVEKIVENLMLIADTNNDNLIDLAEARNIWQLINQKHTRFMLIFNDKSYATQILRFCGDMIEIEKIENVLYDPQQTSNL
jgi:hypothetical protein